MDSKLKTYRQQNGFSQEGLAEASGISIRTIQRIEKGLTSGSAYTLRTLAKTLNVNTTDLMPAETDYRAANGKNSMVKILNLSSLFVVLIPLSNVIIPALIFWKNRHDESVNDIGRKILSFQILWVLVTGLLMLVVPVILLLFAEPLRGGGIPLFVPVYIISAIVNVYFTIKFAVDLNNQSAVVKNLPDIL